MTKPSLIDLHQRLLDGDPLAATPLVEAVLAPMVRIVSKTVPQLYDPHAVEEACLDTLLAYLEKPDVYDPSRSQLLTYLTNMARWRAMTAARKQDRRRAREKAHAKMVHDLGGATDPQHKAESDAVDALLVHQILQERGGDIAKDDGDADVFLLMAAGERFDEAYLEALNLEDTPDNRQEIGRRRERIRGRLRRIRTEYGHE